MNFSYIIKYWCFSILLPTLCFTLFFAVNDQLDFINAIAMMGASILVTLILSLPTLPFFILIKYFMKKKGYSNLTSRIVFTLVAFFGCLTTLILTTFLSPMTITYLVLIVIGGFIFNPQKTTKT